MQVYQITAPHFVAGIGIERGHVTMTAPIVHYMHGWSYGDVSAHCRRNKWTMRDLDALVHEYSTRKFAPQDAHRDADRREGSDTGSH